jgi:Icc-related predicted phosphoesterase
LDDFSKIKDYESWVYSENWKAIDFLAENLGSGDVVVTHHLPSRKSVHPKYERSPLNSFFLCDVEPLIADRQPALWIHGHTHSSSDYQIGATRVVCNPAGYGRENSEDFDPGKIVLV